MEPVRLVDQHTTYILDRFKLYNPKLFRFFYHVIRNVASMY